ncbi:MAG: substrate-binding domain-containing protein [Kiritimatiellae bacterium]|nr:substrate-binding domain-containing protein [Kiritimatiellia bacterium]
MTNAFTQHSNAAPPVLYLSKDGTSPSVKGKLAGIRRYCATQGWEAQPVNRPAFTPAALSAILGERRPVGCIVDGVGNNVGLPPRLFRNVPVVYIGYMRGRTGTLPNFHFDTGAIVETAFRELSANNPPCYAAVGNPQPMRWSRQRVAAFRDAAAARGAPCMVFPNRYGSGGETWDAFVRRLVPWLAKLPGHCAVFAVSDSVAVRVAAAARAAMRHIPKSLTLLSVDNFAKLCEGSEPPLSSIQLDFERIGFVAARALGEILSRRGAEARNSLAGSATPILVGPLMVVRRKSTSGSGRHEKFVAEAVDVIRREACDGLTVKNLLARFPQSRRNFERRFLEAMGHSALDEILSVRLEAATALLAQTGTAISAIPDMCGFRTYRALDFHFRSRFGMSMGTWRERNTR